MLRGAPVLFAALSLIVPSAPAQYPTESKGLPDALGELMDPLETAPAAKATLEEYEREADRRFREIRDAELARYRESSVFPGANPFHRSKAAIEASRVFALLRRMPKGAALHVHGPAAGRARWIVYDATYRRDCYVYWPDVDPGPVGDPLKGQLGFFGPKCVPEGYRATAAVRRQVPDFDEQLLDLLMLGPGEELAPDIWTDFSACFQRLGNVLSYQPVFHDYFVDAFETLAADGVDHVELRIPLDELFDLRGRCWSGVDYIDEYRKVLDDVHRTYPDFTLKLIVAGFRGESREQIRKQLTDLLPIRRGRPEVVVGYDLVGEEDDNHPTSYYAGVLWYAIYVYQVQHGVGLPLYLHDGESNWKSDSNLREAFSLLTRRVGHGLNLHFFPNLEGYYRSKPVPLEVCPISNQALRYVADIRIHPAEGYLRRGVICTLSSDDPAIFGNDGLSFDFWEATMSWQLGLPELKRLARNSIEHSALTTVEKAKALRTWEAKWRRFIDELTPAETD